MSVKKKSPFAVSVNAAKTVDAIAILLKNQQINPFVHVETLNLKITNFVGSVLSLTVPRIVMTKRKISEQVFLEMAYPRAVFINKLEERH